MGMGDAGIAETCGESMLKAIRATTARIAHRFDMHPSRFRDAVVVPICLAGSPT
ncbi:MAG: hypothetical protein DHS20C16_10100 [Phycisphaerae bacterium]|nr:MAG: hypothetical protein DHS20C16_10100 [Phycisphaerae bacterium]